jgi:hypothetical protein
MSGREGTLRVELETGLGVHGLADRVLATAWLLGLDADKVSVKSGWLLKTHRFTIRGPECSLRQMVACIDSMREGEDR